MSHRTSRLPQFNPVYVVFALFLVAPSSGRAQEKLYFPGPADDWEQKTSQSVGFDPYAIQAAVDFARENYAPQRRDETGAAIFGLDEPYGEITGRVKERGGAAGLITRHGYIVAEWGDTDRVDMTYSVTKTYLSTTAGLAVDRGLRPIIAGRRRFK